MSRIRITPLAEQDLAEIWVFHRLGWSLRGWPTPRHAWGQIHTARWHSA